MTLLISPHAKVTQPETYSKRTPFSILLQQYIKRPELDTAIALQFLLNHAEGSKMITPDIAKIATPQLIECIRNSKP